MGKLFEHFHHFKRANTCKKKRVFQFFINARLKLDPGFQELSRNSSGDF